MPDDLVKIATAELDAIRRGREDLILQIKGSRETIEQSRELLRWLDEFLMKADKKP